MAAPIKINQRGNMTLPKPLRKKPGSEKGGVIMTNPSDKGVPLKPAIAFPVEMYSASRIAEFDDAEAGLDRYFAKKRKN